ncbi:MAG: chorismate mutase [Kiritimatiellia bacterium]|jgi:medium-chain acyl-[acyl-carrier-protein] hydrolase
MTTPTPHPPSDCARSDRDILSQWRDDIDSVDREIASLVSRRMALSTKIGEAKWAAGIPVLDPAREAEVLEKAKSHVDEGDRDAVASVMETLMAASRARQRNLFSPEATPQNLLRRSFSVGISDLDEDGRVRPSAICNWLQESATTHAAILGYGMPLLTPSTHSWMLARITVEFHHWPTWGETIAIHTWPSGTKGRLLALRDFLVHDAKGALLATANTEWLNIDATTGKIARLPANFAEMAPEGTPRAPVAERDPPDPKQPLGDGPPLVATLSVRHSDTDVNRHVNHIRFIDWLFEPLAKPGRPSRLDMVFRVGAIPGDIVTSELVEDPATGVRRHRLSRKADDTTLSVAFTHRY